MKSFLVVSREKQVLDTLHPTFYPASVVDQADSADDALEMLRKKRYDLILVDLAVLQETMPAEGYGAALNSFRDLYPAVAIIVISSQDMIREAVKAVKAGAADYLTYPTTPEEIHYVIESVYASLLLKSELDYLRDQFWRTDSLQIIQTNNAAMREVFSKIRSVAPTKSTVLLTGETGTGKGILASLIHQHSNRRDAQFISVHCGAMPDTLLESELFGHERGAFTGAIRRKLGKFEIARGGTIFLDEIATITSSAQIKLLQVLQDGIFQRIGGEEIIKADVRVIAASNMDLNKMCDDGDFRKDLYYRLNVFPLEVPPLRTRKEDIPQIVETILGRLKKFNTKQINGVHPEVMQAFSRYSWPGNIRELENLLERACIIENSSLLTPESFPHELFLFGSSSGGLHIDSGGSLAEVRRRGLEDIEKRYLKELLVRNRGKIKESAEAAGITTRQLHKLMTKYGIRKEEFKSPSI